MANVFGTSAPHTQVCDVPWAGTCTNRFPCLSALYDRYVMNFGQPAITEHVFHFQLLHRDQIMAPDDTVRLFMQKIVPLPRDFLVDFRDIPFGLLPIAGTALFTG
jgi:hypothetical protein